MMKLDKDLSGCTFVESQATMVVGDQDSRAQARATAEAAAIELVKLPGALSPA